MIRGRRELPPHIGRATAVVVARVNGIDGIVTCRSEIHDAAICIFATVVHG